MGIGEQMAYTGRDGKTITGIILNVLPTKMMDVRTGEEFEGEKFYLWDEARKRGVWTCAMRAVEEESRHA